MFIVRALISLIKKAMALFSKKRSEEWRVPRLYEGKSMCQKGTCDCELGGCICCQQFLEALSLVNAIGKGEQASYLLFTSSCDAHPPDTTLEARHEAALEASCPAIKSGLRFTHVVIDVCRALGGALRMETNAVSSSSESSVQNLLGVKTAFATLRKTPRRSVLTRKFLAAVEELSWRRLLAFPLGKEVV